MKQIIIFPVGTIDADTKKLLKRNGCIAIEAQRPEQVVMLLPCSKQLTGDLVLKAALAALSLGTATQERQKFGSEIIRLLSEQSKPTAQIPP